MKQLIIVMGIAIVSIAGSCQPAEAQVPVIDVIKGAVKKAIKAIDLQIQRKQNKVIWLQNAQKTLENAMSKAKLDEIADWVERQRKLYKDYYEELQKVKTVIAYYHRIKDIIVKEARMVQSYHNTWWLFRQDQHFTPDELNYMAKVYAGMLKETASNLDRLYLVINSFRTQMSDAKRLELIDEVAGQVDVVYRDMQRFNRENALLSLQRAGLQHDMKIVRQLYGL